MAESSLYTQRLEAIVGRRKVQERILRTRRELEEEKLRAQQLKRKSLRDQWLMEGSCLPPENNPTSPLWQTQSRIQELEQDLSSLQSQMQQLDNPEHHGRPHEALEDAKQPAGGTCEARGAGCASAGGGGCGCETEPALRLAPVPPKRAMRAAARETLENGDVSRAGPFGVEGVGPGEGKTDASSAAPGTQDDGAGASAKQPEKLGVGKVEMIIRNHLGQEVGSMDAIGRTSPETEGEAPRGENGLEEAWDGRTEREPQSPPALVSDALDSGMEESVAGEGSREGPEGESGALDGEAQALPDENCCLDSPRPEPDGELEEPSGVVEEGEISAEPRGATGMEAAEAAQRAQGRAAEPERPEELGPTQGRGPMWQGPAREREHQVSPGTERPQAAGMGEGAETKAYSQDWIPSPQEAKGALQDQIPAPQDQIPSPQEAKGAPQDQIPSPQEAKGALQDQIPAPQDQIPSPQEAKGALQGQIPALQDQILALKDRIPSPQEAKGAPQDQIPALQDRIPSPQEAKGAPQDQIPALQDRIPSPQEAKGAPQDQIPSVVQDQAPSSLQEAEVSMQNQIPPVQDQIPLSLLEVKTSLQGQILSPQEAKAALQNQIPSSLQEANASLQNQIPSPQEATVALQDQIPSSLQDQIPSSLQDQIQSMRDQIPSSLQEANTSLQNQIPSPQEATVALQDQIPSSLQDQIPSSLQEANASLQNQIPSPQEATVALQDQIPSSLQDQIPSSLQEANASLQNQIPSPQEATVALQDQIPSSLQDQIPSSLQEANTSLQDQVPSPHEAKHSFHSQIPSSQEPIPALHGELPLTPRELPSGRAPGLEQVPSRPRESMALKGGSGTGPVPSTAEETTENLGKLHPEQQPLLKEASGLQTGQKAPLDPAARSLQPGAGTLKSLAAVSPEAPTYTTASANTASPCQGRSATTPRPGDGQETGRRKQKTCQCCSVM
ncbi:paralemmin-3 isoform X3 [Chrysemys picta bellii]|uniref:paralemmin-3 isoform X3 n=1 Tax=Chrysemys picta bellii TaxID=8478 RepID=UPI0032B26E56